MFGPARRTWVLGGGGARGAAQVGVLQALFEAGVEGPVAVVGTSVGALNGSAIAAYPSLAGTMMLREVWMSRQAVDVFRAHPLGVILSGLRRDQVSAFPQQNIRRLIQRAQALTGITTFEQLRVPLAVVATDLPSIRWLATTLRTTSGRASSGALPLRLRRSARIAA